MVKLSWSSFAFGTILLFLLCERVATNNNITNVAVAQTNLTSILEYTSIIFALTTLSNENIVGTICNSQLQQLRQDTLKRELWALKVLDASGRPTAGFMYGDNFWLGSREGCNAAQNVITLNTNKYIKRRMNPELLTTTSPFAVDYRILYLEHNSPWQVDAKLGQQKPAVHVGLCMPRACSLTELTQLMTNYLESDLYAQIDLLDTKPRVLYAKDLKLSADFFTQPVFLLVCAFTIFTFLLSVAAFRASKRQVSAAGTQTQLQQFINCFNVQTNWHKLFILPGRTTNNLTMLNGSRFICALIAIYFHIYILLSNLSSNTMELFVISNGIGSMDVAVDFFFSISGFLAAYNFLRNEKKLKKIRENSALANFKELLTNMLHRLIRLGPLYLMVIGVSDLWFHYRGDVGVFLMIAEHHAMCVNKGWYNVFFLQNFVDFSEGCQAWTWSLACDLQYFTLIAALLIIYAKYPRVAKVAVVTILCYCVVHTYRTGLALNFQISLESSLAFFKEMYAHPAARVMPYVFGAIAAWFYIEWNPKIAVSKAVAEATSYLVIVIVFFFIQSAPLGYGYSVSVDTLLLILQRFCVSLCVCWSIICLANGHVAWLVRFLNWKGFQKGFEVSFAMSVINQSLIYTLYSFLNQPLHVEMYTNTVTYIGLVVVLYFISGFFALFFEMPYRNWLSVLHKRQREKAT